MRDIKFRAWDKENKEMYYQGCIYGSGINWVIESNDEYWGMFDINNHNKRVCGNADGSGILMQYTGLKDKNGVELYEGDITKSCENNIRKVVWERNSWKYYFEIRRVYEGEPYTEKIFCDIGATSSKRWGDEIIGNIYENPELLKVQ